MDSFHKLFAAGVRVFGLTHFVDNEVGGSATGVEQYGLTTFGAYFRPFRLSVGVGMQAPDIVPGFGACTHTHTGREVVQYLNDNGGVIDLAHTSEAVT